MAPDVLAVELAGDQEIAIDLTIGQLQGRVVSAATGQPIANRDPSWRLPRRRRRCHTHLGGRGAL